MILVGRRRFVASSDEVHLRAVSNLRLPIVGIKPQAAMTCACAEVTQRPGRVVVGIVNPVFRTVPARVGRGGGRIIRADKQQLTVRDQPGRRVAKMTFGWHGGDVGPGVVLRVKDLRADETHTAPKAYISVNEDFRTDHHHLSMVRSRTCR